MKRFTAWEYMLIDLANAYGLDKQLFEDRIKWAQDNYNQLHELAIHADNKPLYAKALISIGKARAGKPTGHTVALDAVCSGIQIMSALTGCVAGATNTGLVDPYVRADAYTNLKHVMQDILGGHVSIIRDDAKDALMTMYYGSKRKPREIFGIDTPELRAFYKAAEVIAPGAYKLLQALLNSWRPYALFHSWKLPDGYDARVKVMVDKSARITVDELNKASFTYEFQENEGTKTGLSNVANLVHSVDAYILRCIERRCSYDPATVLSALKLLQSERNRRVPGYTKALDRADKKIHYYIDQYKRSTVADVVILPYINTTNVEQLSVEHIDKLIDLIHTMLVHKPFYVITVHDEFRCHPNYMNFLRQHYINIFAEIADSHLLSDLLSQLYGVSGKADKLSTNLGTLIRGSNYALS